MLKTYIFHILFGPVFEEMDHKLAVGSRRHRPSLIFASTIPDASLLEHYFCRSNIYP